MLTDNYFILSMPRSGSSMLTNVLIQNGLTNFTFEASLTMNGHEHNRDGYFEDVKLTLLNDQIIRSKYGDCHSFLFPPDKYSATTFNNLDSYSYDLNEETVLFPPNFNDRLLHYTNNTWDVWGLSRMLPGEKWHKAYSKHGVENNKGILRAISDFKFIYENKSGLVIKDPRMIFTLQEFRVEKPKVIFLHRESESVIASCRRHYGPRLFDTTIVDKQFPFSSNHFNLKVNSMDFEKFSACYANFERCIKDKIDDNSYIDLRYEELLIDGSDSRRELETFLGETLNWTRVRDEKM